jgi:hypothetical protein
MAGEVARVVSPLARRVAAADDGDRVGGQKFNAPLQMEQQRRIGSFEQRRRIKRVAERHDRSLRRLLEPD